MKLDLNINKCHKKEVKIGIATSSRSGESRVSKWHNSIFETSVMISLYWYYFKAQGAKSVKMQYARAISALNPELTISNSNLAGNRMNDLPIILHESNLIKADISDRSSMQFGNFYKLASSTNNGFKEFDM